MKLINLALLGSSLLSAATATTIHFERDATLFSARQYLPGAYIVELNDGEDIDPFLEELRARGLDVKGRRRLTSRFFHGLSFEVRDNSEPDHRLMKRIASPNKTKNIWPVHIVPMPEHTPVATSSGKEGQKVIKRGEKTRGFTHHAQIQIDKLHKAGFTGKGIRIGIIDTGVDYKHPALGGCFGEGCLISYGADLVGPNFDFDHPPVEDDDPMEDNNCWGSYGHGTHVAGVIAAQPNEYGFVGAAPGATIGFYKICGGVPYPIDITVDAIARAAEDGSDIVTYAVGLASSSPNDPAALISTRVAESGIPVVMSASNAGGFSAYWTATSPCVGGLVTCVGATVPDTLPLLLLEGTYSIDDGPEETYGRINRQANGIFAGPRLPADFAENVTLPLWDADFELGGKNAACQPLPEHTPNLSDRLVLIGSGDPWGIRDEDCPPSTMVPNLVAKGAKYILVYYRRIGTTRYLSIGAPDDISWGFVPTPFATTWREAVAAGSNVTVSIVAADSATEYLDFFHNDDNPNAVTLFSSWGPTGDLHVKPQVVAPGDFLLSTYPLAAGGYSVIGGTSFSSPMVAGLYALLMEARKTKDPKELLSVVTGTAKNLNWFNEVEFKDFPAPVAQQGTGVVQGWDAYKIKTTLDRESFSFNDTVSFEGKHTFAIHNRGNKKVTYKIKHVKGPAGYALPDDGGVGDRPRSVEIVQASPKIKIKPESVTIEPGKKASIQVEGVAPEGLGGDRLPVYGGWIEVKSKDGQQKLSLPYVGLAGSLAAASAILPGQKGGTWFGTVGGTDEVEANTSFRIPRPIEGERVASYIDLRPGDPMYHVMPRTSPPILRVDVVALDDVDIPTDDHLGYKTVGHPIDLLGPFPVHHPPRSAFTTRFNGMLWTGVIVPEGRYQFVVSSLRVYGDEDNVEDWDVVELAPFNLEYTTS